MSNAHLLELLKEARESILRTVGAPLVARASCWFWRALKVPPGTWAVAQAVEVEPRLVHYLSQEAPRCVDPTTMVPALWEGIEVVLAIEEFGSDLGTCREMRSFVVALELEQSEADPEAYKEVQPFAVAPEASAAVLFLVAEGCSVLKAFLA